MQAGADEPKQREEKKAPQGPATWEQRSHFPASTQFPEITVNYILNLDARLIPPQSPAEAPQCVAQLIFLTSLSFFFLTSQVLTQSLEWEAAA